MVPEKGIYIAELVTAQELSRSPIVNVELAMELAATIGKSVEGVPVAEFTHLASSVNATDVTVELEVL